MNQPHGRGWLGRAFLSSLVFVSIVAIGCTLPEVKRAEQLAKAGNWDGAVAAYREAQKKEPFDPAIQTALEQAKGRAAEQHYAEGRRLLNETRLAVGLDGFVPPALGGQFVGLSNFRHRAADGYDAQEDRAGQKREGTSASPTGLSHTTISFMPAASCSSLRARISVRRRGARCP